MQSWSFMGFGEGGDCQVGEGFINKNVFIVNKKRQRGWVKGRARVDRGSLRDGERWQPGSPVSPSTCLTGGKERSGAATRSAGLAARATFSKCRPEFAGVWNGSFPQREKGATPRQGRLAAHLPCPFPAPPSPPAPRLTGGAEPGAGARRVGGSQAPKHGISRDGWKRKGQQGHQRPCPPFVSLPVGCGNAGERGLPPPPRRSSAGSLLHGVVGELGRGWGTWRGAQGPWASQNSTALRVGKRGVLLPTLAPSFSGDTVV